MKLGKLLCFWLGLTSLVAQPVLSLPPPEDLPEEVLRTEIITEARSPIDGKLLSAAEYAELQARLAERSTPTELDPQIQQQIFLLRLLKLFRLVTPW
ncbi:MULTISPECIES: hypothetical protein [unclassified Coleofasciculus]|uniref:hypothetical protein n=1 Tax=unclassified Coleofasciculus TaxID=2692782 RepID=UPI001882F17D|nr:MULTISPECIES: hypothetical protein [unclassified Coleofasciculus]MBE9125547.1 hypothetical protein [Coleofasciculus sp. LEGE 07081]MBE9147818.1 hypothetical protein [Coleofasciculus sp. LEGE 07092]